MTAGTITILAGPMRCDDFSVAGQHCLGKTSGLIAVAQETIFHHGAGSVMALQPSANVRDKGWLLSPSGARFRATVLEDPLEAWNSLDRDPGYKALVIDEAHLWLRKEKELLALMLKARHKGLSVWLAGIEFDHMGKPFPWWPSIRPEADAVHRLTAPCDCGARAAFTFRHGLSDASIQVDHLGHYQSCCLACFAIFRTARELRKQIAGLT